ncbi:ELO family [Sesbania bispinosa]|nr:ELO family [Sesbania bispinosa]
MGFPVVPQPLKYWLLDHPSIVWFRWSPTQSWGSTWPFLITAITVYITTALTLHVILKIFRRRRPVPLGPIPAIHSLAMSLISVTIFTGMLFSAGAEIRDTRWLWRRTRTTPIEWFLCFPLGIRPSGRVFFWLFNHSILLIMSFLWLEFSQSFQVLGILFSTLVYSAVYGYRFWTEIGLPSKSFTFTVNCQMVLLGCNLVCHFGVLSLHFLRGGCNGIGAWVFNSVLNAAILMLFLKSYVNMYCQRKNTSVAHHSSFDGVEGLSKQGNVVAKLKT